MKKFLMLGFAALAFIGCKNTDLSGDIPNGYKPQGDPATQYANAFKNVFGTPAANQTWGFGIAETATPAKAMKRSAAELTVPSIAAPYDATWVANYLTTATEPNSSNVDHNANNSYTASCQWYATGGGKLSKLMNNYEWCTNNGISQEEKDWYTTNILPLLQKCNYNWNSSSDTAYEILMKLKEYTGDYNYWNLTVNSEGGYVKDPNWVINFKITGTYTGVIGVAASEGSSSPGSQRTIVVTGTWNINDGQKIGSLGRVIIANGGTVNVASGKKLNMVNQAQLVVLQGGKLTGEGSIEINNGSAEGKEAYNGGTIDIATFNNNFGKFYNYGKFLVDEYQAGATESNFYNHGLAAIDHTAGDANARVFNACQFYVENNARMRNYLGVQGSALIVGGQFMPFGSADGTSVPSNVTLAAGALVKCGSLYNGSSWDGPTEGYAALEIVNQIDYLNWVQDSPQTAGYFANNIYVKCGNWENDPEGQGYHQDDASDVDNYNKSRAKYKFFEIAANCKGNGNVKKVEDGDYEVIPADDNFVLGEAGCTPGFKIEEVDNKPSLHVMAEDLSATEKSDFDFNDVVLDVFYVNENTVKITLLAAGGTLPLRIAENDEWEVHKLFGVPVTCMVNTGTKYHTAKSPYTQETKPYVELTLTGKTWSKDQNDFAGEVNTQIKLEVQKDGTWYELTAKKGDPACKVATPVNINMKDYDWYPEEYRWPYEKQSVGESFSDYVSDPVNEKFYIVE